MTTPDSYMAALTVLFSARNELRFNRVVSEDIREYAAWKAALDATDGAISHMSHMLHLSLKGGAT